jgi:hypothetical protein
MSHYYQPALPSCMVIVAEVPVVALALVSVTKKKESYLTFSGVRPWFDGHDTTINWTLNKKKSFNF